MSERRAQFNAGFREMLRAGPAIVVWGLVTGVAMAKSSLTVAQCLGMSLLVYGGSAQLASLPLLAAGAPLAVICLTALIINLRFLIFSAAMRSHFMHLSTRQRSFYGYWVADITFIMFMDRAQHERLPSKPEAYFLGLSVANWTCWQIGSIVGITAAEFVPTDWGLELAGMFALLALILPQCSTRPGLAGVVAASIVGVLGAALPMRLGVLLAVVAGIGCAVAVETRLASRAQ